MELEEVEKLLLAVHPTPVQDYIIAQERHKDGCRHIHAFLRYEKKITYKFDLWDIAGHHGNYQRAKSPTAVIAYCAKERNFRGNINPFAHLKGKAARNEKLLSTDLNQLVELGEIGLQQLPSLHRAKELFRLSKPITHAEDVKGIWIYGPSGIGKSHFCRHRHPDAYIKDQTKWWTGYIDQEVVLLEDFDIQGQCLSHHIKIWADKWGATVESKGGHVLLRHRLMVVTSNYSIEAIFTKSDPELLQAIQRRFKEFYCETRADFEKVTY